MGSYDSSFARVYNIWWTEFSTRVAPHIYRYYSERESSSKNRTLLDLCCGTGQLSLYFLDRGFHVTGLDLSEAMLEQAEKNTQSFVTTGQARFIQADAAAFSIDMKFDLVVSTFDAMNHLPGLIDLNKCFSCVYASMVPGATFIFDLNTLNGLKRWNHVNIQEEHDDVFIISRGIYDGERKAYNRVNGFVREFDGRYTRFEHIASNVAYELETVRRMLVEMGWNDVYFANINDLGRPLLAPEDESRVFVIARR